MPVIELKAPAFLLTPSHIRPRSEFYSLPADAYGYSYYIRTYLTNMEKVALVIGL